MTAQEKNNIDTSHHPEEKAAKSQDLALPFCEVTVLHHDAYRQQKINIFQATMYLPIWTSLSNTNLFPAKRSSSCKQKIVGLII